MQFESAKRRAEELRAQLNYHSHKYYVEDDPEIEDSEYDMLQRELARLRRSTRSLSRQIRPLSESAAAPRGCLSRSLTPCRSRASRMRSA